MKLWRGLAGTGCAAAAVLATVLVTRLGVLPPAAPQYLVVLVAPQDKSPGWVVQASSPKTLSLIPLGQADVWTEKSLQFWTKGDNWNGPVSLGLVKPGQTVRIPLDTLPPLQPNRLFELTLEPANGSPTNRPTGPIQFIGRAVKVT
ncbi:Probable transmembrane protein [Polaromonas sp. CG9_12]|nr:Probable transmembrane protein [Polaromonas sp. CG9_12]